MNCFVNVFECFDIATDMLVDDLYLNAWLLLVLFQCCFVCLRIPMCFFILFIISFVDGYWCIWHWL